MGPQQFMENDKNNQDMVVALDSIARALYNLGTRASGPQTSSVATSENTTSTSYTDLATVGPTCTVTVPATGMVIIMMTVEMWNTVGGSFAEMALDISGANTIAPGGLYRLFCQATAGSTPDNKYSYMTLMTGLNPGSTTFKSKYRVITSGSGVFQSRQLSVIPLA